MLVTLFGMVTLVSPVHSQKAYAGMFVTRCPKMTVFRLGQSPNENAEYAPLPLYSFPIEIQFTALKLTVSNPVQPRKATSPMLVIPSGMVMLVNPVQPKKAESPMLVTLSGIMMFLSSV